MHNLKILVTIMLGTLMEGDVGTKAVVSTSTRLA